MYWTVHLHSSPRRINYAAVVVGSSIITFGGYYNAKADDEEALTIFALDTVKLKWWKLDKVNDVNAPSQRCGFSTVAYDKKIYLWGGNNDFFVCGSVFCYDTETLKWSISKVQGYVPEPRSGHSACMIGQRMYIYGGRYERYFCPEMCMYDVVENTWYTIQTENNPPPIQDFHTVTAVGDRMYIFGGRCGKIIKNRKDHEVYSSDVYYYDTTLNIWVRPIVHGHKPPGRRNHSAFFHNNFWYIYGGFDKNEKTYFDDLYRYNVVRSTWSKVTPIGTAPCARKRQISLVVEDRVFIYGGISPLPVTRLFPTRGPKICRRKGNRLKHHDDLHVLDLNPSLKDICLVKFCESVNDEKMISSKDLCIPKTLRRDLYFHQPTDIFNVTITDSEYEDEEEYEVFFQ
ncbi:kelch domain-containing protein 3-like [Adelges cooleyi]|uniref:kelch domain-containing protein 3-like n=1 Tax=Adelges cooleyi TaxID=133065 RepID=UPI00217F4618|nr:kelch domain-containing protein 3-like [Adelges cooleyi]XP_050433494.1 kelch domain-containing protein 3-like [Adelges cooleyi]